MSEARRRFEPLLTAAEAFVAFEKEVLAAKEEIIASFRIFDFSTKLHSDEALELGDTWFDLLAHVVGRGVKFSLILSDFDPVVRPIPHSMAWQSMQQAAALAEVTERPDLIDVHCSLHPSRVGLLPRAALWLQTKALIADEAKKLNGMDNRKRARQLRLRPGLSMYFALDDGGKVFARNWPIPTLVPVTHHQKLAVIDNDLLYIGGLDLNDRRWDTWQHDQIASETWHDAQLIVTGEAAREARKYLLEFRACTMGEAKPSKFTHLIRTLSRRRQIAMPFMSPKPLVSEIAEAHYRNAAAATDLIYMESQFFRDRKLARTLADAAKTAPDLGLILIIPGAPEDVAFYDNDGQDAKYGEYLQADCLRILQKAFGSRLFVGSSVQPREVLPEEDNERGTLHGAPLIYVHAKVSVFDDTRGIISSANLNGRSFRWDTEAGIETSDPQEVRAIREKCFRHWLPNDADDKYFSGRTAVSAWRALARRNAQTSPKARRGFIVPHPVEPEEEFGENLPGVPEEMV